MTLSNNRTLTFSENTSVSNDEPSFYIKQLNVPNNASLRFAFNPGAKADGTGYKIHLYVESLAGGTINGNQLYNMTNAPHQLVIHYIGSTAMTLNGTASMRAELIAPFASIGLSGNFSYYGCIQALGLSGGGSSLFRYDEACGGSPVQPENDLSFSITKISHRYR